MAAPSVIATQARLLLSIEDGSSAPGAEYNPAVSGLADGGFVAVWDDFLPSASDADGGTTTVVRAFSANGKPRGLAALPVIVDRQGDFGGLEAVVTLLGGRVAVAWDAGDATGSRLGARILNPKNGAGVGEALTIEGPARGSGRDILLHGLVPLPDGSAGVLYVNREEESANALRLAVLKPDGRRGADVLLLRQGIVDPFVTTLGAVDTLTVLQGVNAGVIAVLTREPFNNAIGVQFFESSGDTVLPPVNVGDTGGFSPILAATADGGVAVLWGAPGSTGANLYRLLRIDANGDSNDTPLDIQLDGGFFGSQDLLGLPDGGLLLATTAVATDAGFRSEIVLQRLSATGGLDGDPVVLGDPNVSYADPQLSLSGDDQVVVTYEESGNQILATRLDLNTPEPVTPAPTIVGTAGDNTLRGTPADDRIDGRAGHDQIIGLAGDDRLIGGSGRDQLLGGLGDDTLIGGAGKDLLKGGAGRDIYTFNRSDRGGSDRLVGWQNGDRISLEGLGRVAFLGRDRFPGGAGEAAVRVLLGSAGTLVQVDSGDRDGRTDFSIQFDRNLSLLSTDFLLG